MLDVRLRPEPDDVAVPIRSDRVPLIVVTPREVMYASRLGDKRAMVARLHRAHVLMAAWPGEWRTDVFVLDHARARAVLDG